MVLTSAARAHLVGPADMHSERMARKAASAERSWSTSLGVGILVMLW